MSRTEGSSECSGNDTDEIEKLQQQTNELQVQFDSLAAVVMQTIQNQANMSHVERSSRNNMLDTGVVTIRGAPGGQNTQSYNSSSPKLSATSPSRKLGNLRSSPSNLAATNPSRASLNLKPKLCPISSLSARPAQLGSTVTSSGTCFATLRRVQDAQNMMSTAVRNGNLQDALQKRELQLAEAMRERHAVETRHRVLERHTAQLIMYKEDLEALERTYVTDSLRCRAQTKSLQLEVGALEKTEIKIHEQIEALNGLMHLSQQRRTKSEVKLLFQLEELNKKLDDLGELRQREKIAHEMEVEAKRQRVRLLEGTIFSFNPDKYVVSAKRREQEMVERKNKRKTDKNISERKTPNPASYNNEVVTQNKLSLEAFLGSPA